MGLVGHEHSFLRDGWNRLDLAIVTASWLPLLFPSLSNTSGMRAVRALRPLRTINRLPRMRRQVATLIGSLPHLVDVALLSAFLMVVFGVLGLQLFKGSLSYRCYAVGAAEPIDAAGTSGASGVCAPSPAERSAGRLGERSGDLLGDGLGGATAAAGARQGTCAAGEECRRYGVNPAYGTISFDDIVGTFVTIFQCVTLEGWTDVLYMTSRSSGPLVATSYFVALVWLGAFYVLNLFLAVMWHTYNEQPKEDPIPPPPPYPAAPAAAAGPASAAPYTSAPFMYS